MAPLFIQNQKQHKCNLKEGYLQSNKPWRETFWLDIYHKLLAFHLVKA